VLFLDELPEFQRKVLEVLREPLESGEIVIARASRQVTYPAQFQLIAAMNPCPCGYYGDSERACRCTTDQIRRYRDRLSGPLLDRIDLQVPVNRLPRGALSSASSDTAETATLQQQVLRARDRQLQRQQKVNAQLSGTEIDRQYRCSESPRARRSRVEIGIIGARVLSNFESRAHDCRSRRLRCGTKESHS
jgi:magnesium chelatase family protein